MPYTVQQAQQAIQKAKCGELVKTAKLKAHIENKALVTSLKLPYRLIKDSRDKLPSVLNKNGIMSIVPPKTEEMQMHRFYPKHTEDLQDFEDWLLENDVDLLPLYKKYIGLWNDNEFLCNGILSDAEIKAMQEAKENYAISQQSFSTEQERRFYFARFYVGYDFDYFNDFDFWGEVDKHTPEEIEIFRKECQQIQADFQEHTNKYFTDNIPLYKPDNEP